MPRRCIVWLNSGRAGAGHGLDGLRDHRRTALAAANFYVLQSGGWSYGETLAPHDPLYLQAATACLATIVVMQIVKVWLCRSDRTSIARIGAFWNWLILLGIAFEIGVITLIVYTSWGNALFGTVPLTLDVWLFAVPFALAMVLAEELRKVIVRRC